MKTNKSCINCRSLFVDYSKSLQLYQCCECFVIWNSDQYQDEKIDCFQCGTCNDCLRQKQEEEEEEEKEEINRLREEDYLRQMEEEREMDRLRRRREGNQF